MTPDDIRLLADASPYQRDMLRAFADLVEAGQTLCKPGKPICWAPLQQALARVEELRP